MNMPVREDELLLWEAVESGEKVRTAHVRLGIPVRRAYRLVCKWSSQGRYDWGVAWDLGWSTSSYQSE